MLPTNSGKAKDQGCSPVSSNCVVWQGPDLPCIGLCKGDTVSDVIEKLATELCTLVEMFNLSEFDFTCLSVPASEQPEDLGGLIQILIDRICELENITPDPTDPTTSDCPDNCIVPIAPCFYFINPQGDTVTTLSLLDYVTAIGNQICDILSDITVLQNEVQTLQDQVNGNGSGPVISNPAGIVGEIGDLNAEKVNTTALDYQVNTKTDPTAGVQFITNALRYVEDSLILTQDAVGTNTELYSNILKAGLIGSEPQLFGVGNMNSITGWTDNVETLAEAHGNLWLAITDLRNAVEYIQENCCSTQCSDIFLNFRATVNIGAATTLTVFSDGSTGFTDDWRECDNDTRITVTDEAGNTTTFRTSLIAIIDQPSGFTIDITSTTLDPLTDLTVVAETCFTNTSTETTCEKDYEYIIRATADCPAVVLTIAATSVSYQFTSTPGETYIANVYFDGGSTPVASQIIATPGVIVLNSIFGLLVATDYEFELVVVNSIGEQTPCPKQAFTTLPASCQPPINSAAIVTI